MHHDALTLDVDAEVPARQRSVGEAHVDAWAATDDVRPDAERYARPHGRAPDDHQLDRCRTGRCRRGARRPPERSGRADLQPVPVTQARRAQRLVIADHRAGPFDPGSVNALRVQAKALGERFHEGALRRVGVDLDGDVLAPSVGQTSGEQQLHRQPTR